MVISPAVFKRLCRVRGLLHGDDPRPLRAIARCAAGSVTDVCLAVGLSSPGSFSHLFGRRVGVRPSTYRRQPPPRGPAPGCISLMAPLP
jgi:AraC-like DNA-binding protein